MRALPVGHPATEVGVQFIGPARPIDPIRKTPSLDHPHPSERAGGDDLTHAADGQIEAVGMPDHEQNARRLCGLNHGLGAVERSRHGLFGQDVLARRAGEHHMVAVKFGGGADVDNIKIAPCKHRRQAIEAGYAGLLFDFGARLVVGIGHGAQGEAVVSKDGRQEGSTGCAQADQSQAKPIRSRLSCHTRPSPRCTLCICYNGRQPESFTIKSGDGCNSQNTCRRFSTS